jgi:hypothetical protein
MLRCACTTDLPEALAAVRKGLSDLLSSFCLLSQSLALVKNLMRVSVSTICYLRGLFSEVGGALHAFTVALRLLSAPRTPYCHNSPPLFTGLLCPERLREHESESSICT